MNAIYPVIMAGGTGTRLWPVSRKRVPKQFQAMLTQNSMLVETVNRLLAGKAAGDISDPIVICSVDHTDMVLDQCRKNQTKLKALIEEPVGRNTAAAAAIASLVIEEMDPDGMVLLMPADHFITDVPAYWKAVGKGLGAARNGCIATLGISPTHPETGYGYIKTGKAITDDIFLIESFTEKPNVKTASKYVHDGNYYWNSGIFMFGATLFLEEFKAQSPDILVSCEAALKNSRRKNETITLDTESFYRCRSQSIDCAIMEKTKKGAIVAPVSIGWSDVGGWSSVRTILSGQDENKTVTIGNVFADHTKRSLIRSDGPFVAAIGVEDLVIVATDDAVLVTTVDRAQEVKDVVDWLEEEKKEKFT